MDSKKRLVVARAIAILLVVMLLSPIAIYVSVFGGQLSNNHTRWSEFGSLLGGIYTPILAALTLVVLVLQVRSQNEATILQTDHSYIEQSRADIEFYLHHLEQALDLQHHTGTTVRRFLQETYCHRSDE
ncbi:MAG: hypothetical protein ACK5A0_14885, partial [Polaromonas sp.]